MRAKSLILIFIALLCGLVASIGISQVLDGRGEQASGEPTEKIFVAINDIDIAEKLGPHNIRLEDWPRSRVPEGAVRDLAELDNRYARTRFYKGEVIHASKLMDSTGGVVETIPDGFRVCSARVNMETSVSGLVRPGDRVDIIAVLKKSRDIPETTTKVILRAVRVFAVNHETERQVDKDGAVIDAKTVSLLVKDTQVGRLMLAMELGVLRLSLRGPDDESLVAADDTTIPDLLGKKSERASDEKVTDGDSQPAANPLASFLSQVPAPATTPVATVAPPVFQMSIHTPGGIQRFEWTDPEKEPELVTPGRRAEPLQLPPALQDAVEQGSLQVDDNLSEGSPQSEQPSGE